MKSKYFLATGLLCLLLLSGCSGISGTPVAKLDYKPDVGTSAKPIKIPCCKSDIEITYLGVSGFLIERGNFAVLTAPFFSNPEIIDLTTSISPNIVNIEKGIDGVSLANVRLILVGHAHYDHLMDVPYIVKKIKTQSGKEPKIYGSKTMKHLFLRTIKDNPDLFKKPENNIEALNSKAASFGTRGEWTCFNEQDQTNCSSQDVVYRFMAINSEHAPHFAGHKFFSGTVESSQGDKPNKAADWKEGQTFVYLMDFLGSDKNVDLRIHFQDATSNPPAGFLPVLNPEDQTERVDVALVCVAGYGEVKNYPEGIMRNLKPRHVLLSHWENFFKPLPLKVDKLEVVPGTNLNHFIDRLEGSLPPDADYTFPAPKSKLVFDPN